jgi:hypothetical protein
MQALEKLSGYNKVTLVWIDGDHGRPGNKKLINWPRNGLMEFLLTRLLASPLLWIKKSSGVI